MRDEHESISSQLVFALVTDPTVVAKWSATNRPTASVHCQALRRQPHLFRPKFQKINAFERASKRGRIVNDFTGGMSTTLARGMSEPNPDNIDQIVVYIVSNPAGGLLLSWKSLRARSSPMTLAIVQKERPTCSNA
ncbi:hypothetical protein H9L39_16193 [Fusarium oxysporum f. sp. albedinis]|nr:hypothetical protein H9L39_16193 [Fusarium oxysporum f. sp. albedinis]